MPLLPWEWKNIKETKYEPLNKEDDFEETNANHRNKGESISSYSLCKKLSASFLAVMFVSAILHITLVWKINQDTAEKFMQTLNTEAAVWVNKIAQAKWNYASNLSEINLQESVNLEIAYNKWFKEKLKLLKLYDWRQLKDLTLKRQFESYSSMEEFALPEYKAKRLNEILSEMEKIYSTTKLRKFKALSKDKDSHIISIQPELLNIFSDNNKTSCELSYYWEGWHSLVGRRVRKLFQEYVSISNEAAQLNNFTDMAENWMSSYEIDDLELQIKKLYNQILPLYKQLHAYVRNKLSIKYNVGEQNIISKHGPIPAHILGNVWSQQWQNIFDSTIPYPKKKLVDVTQEMIAQNYTIMKMFKLSEKFFLSLNLSAMTKSFWQKSIFEKPKDREMVCHGSAWDFHNGEDYRIKMCTVVSYDMLKTVHHEMGHVQYYQQYKDQPLVFQSGANPGFHEAIGETLALSVATEEHLRKIGLIGPNTYLEDKEDAINSLYRIALDKVAFLPYAYTLERWRWEVFQNNVSPTQYNQRFWELRQELGGIVPPVDRTTEDFDPGAKYHVISGVPYIRYFISFIVQFQFHKALCIKVGKYNPEEPMSNPLHKCDIYERVEAGNLLRSMLQLGSSKPWQDAMEVLTGQREMDAGPFLEYFQPLQVWLEQENERNGQLPGWVIAPKKGDESPTLSDTNASAKLARVCRYVFKTPSHDKSV